MLEVQPALPSLELVEEVVPFATEEAQLGKPENRSFTLVIEGVLGKLTLKVETIEAKGN